MNIYMYTVYTYLSVDIYECMSNVSITCRYRRYVLSPYISCYICICSSILSVPLLITCTLIFTHMMYMYVCDCDRKYHNRAEVADESSLFVCCCFFFVVVVAGEAEACNHRVYWCFLYSFWVSIVMRVYSHAAKNAGGSLRWIWIILHTAIMSKSSSIRRFGSFMLVLSLSRSTQASLFFFFFISLWCLKLKLARDSLTNQIHQAADSLVERWSCKFHKKTKKKG